jgi:hypothetical protein
VRRLTLITAGVLACVFVGSTVVRGAQAPKTLHEAAATGDVEQIKQYVAKKANLNALDGGGYTPLKRATEAGQLEAVKALLDGGANPNVKDAQGLTVLHWVCMSDRADIAEALLAGKADPAAKDPAGRAPLHCAVQSGQLGIVEALIKGGADVNALTTGGQSPLGMAQQQNMTEIADLLQKHGGKVPPPPDMYGGYGDAAGGPQAAQVVGTVSERPADFVIDANAIREELKKYPALEAPLKVLDANSLNEQRAWITRRSDNRSLLVRAVQKQFEDEMVVVKRTAGEEKAAKTTKAIDDLVSARKKRYERIGEQLREQRRQSLQESRDTNTMAGGRGRGGNANGTATTGRGGRGRSSTGAAGDPFGATTPARTPRRAAVEPNEPPVDADTQAQIDAWLNAQPENKAELLKTSHELDVIEYAKLHASATEEQAAKTQVAVMALLMLREGRIAKIEQKWIEDDARMQKMQERTGTTGMQGTQGMQQGTQQGTRRGRR